jgi:hypothetical protein
MGLAGCLSGPFPADRDQKTADGRLGFATRPGQTSVARLASQTAQPDPARKGPTPDYTAARAATPYATVHSGPRPALLPPLRPVPGESASVNTTAAKPGQPLRPIGHFATNTRSATPSVAQITPTQGKPARAGAPLLRLVNTKRITLNFEITDVGPSGLGAVELWYTQDGRDWKKYDAPTQAQAYVVEVDEEGMYGFTLLAKSGTGQAKDPPTTGDQPQVWVIVDLTKPDVRVAEVVPSSVGGRKQVAIRWNASDKNLGRQPITLSWAEKEDGPWQPIAASQENTGSYLWQVPPGTPPRFLVRVEASDLAGNVGRAQTARPVVLDTSTPTVSIVNVEANASR